MNKNINRIIGGSQAKRRGDSFENILTANATINNWSVIRIPDGCKQISAKKIIRVKTPFDFVLLKDKNAIFCDAKTTLANTFSPSKVTPHQLFTLTEIYRQGFKAGYIVNFTEANQTFFFDGLKSNQTLNRTNGLLIGSNDRIDLDLIFRAQIVMHDAMME